MKTPLFAELLQHFHVVSDPRVERTREHELVDLLVIALCGFLCGFSSWVAIERWADSHEDWFKQFLTLPNGIPSHDTFGRLFARLNPDQLEECIRGWLVAVAERLGFKHVAIDGKTLRGSRDSRGGKKALHLVTVWATDQRLTLGQKAVDEKSNEITAIPELLKILDLEGALVSIDAMGCQKAIAATIREQKADYLLQVKGNQERLYEDVERLALEALEKEYAGLGSYHQAERSHGREEERFCFVLTDLDSIRDLALWKDLKRVVVVVSTRTINGASSSETRYYISSRVASARAFAEGVRQHWGVENQCHWILDVVFGEDGNRTRKDHGPQNMAMLRRLALSILKKAKLKEKTIKGRAEKASYDEAVREKILLDFLEI